MNHSDSDFQKKRKQDENGRQNCDKRLSERIRNAKKKWIKTSSLIEGKAKISESEKEDSNGKVIDDALDIKHNRAMKTMFKKDETPIKPPSFIPPYPSWQNGSKSIADCLYCYTYIWQFNGMNYWFYPIENSSRTISGFIWSRKRWSHHLIHHYSIRAHHRHKKK